FAWLDKHRLTDNTLVLFMTDNGPATVGYNAGYRGRKSEVYERGLRSPFFAHWPKRLKPGMKVDAIAAHIDNTFGSVPSAAAREDEDRRPESLAASGGEACQLAGPSAVLPGSSGRCAGPLP